MPTYDHGTLGQIGRTVYLPGEILATYPEHPDTPEEKWDTADIEFATDLSPAGATWMNAPIFYHCDPYQKERPNGSIVDGARGFSKGDKVIVLCSLPPTGTKVTDEEGNERQFSHAMVVGHQDGPQKCEYNFALVRIGKNELLPLEPPFGTWAYSETTGWQYTRNDPESYKDEFCIIFDALTGDLAKIPDPEICRNAESPEGYAYYEFPTTINQIKPYLDDAKFRGVGLFSFTPQGSSEVQWAKADTVNWTEDTSGQDIMDSHNSLAGHFLPYQFEQDPIEGVFYDFRSAIQTADEGIANGDWPQLEKIFNDNYERFTKWHAHSKGACLEENTAVHIPGESSKTGSGWNPGEEPMPPQVSQEIARLQTQKVQLGVEIEEERRAISDYETDIAQYEERLPELRADLEEAQELLEDAEEDYETIKSGWGPSFATYFLETINKLRAEVKNLEHQIASIEEAIPATYDLIEDARGQIDTYREQIGKTEEQITALENGANPFTLDKAVTPDGSLAYGDSREIRVAYGENEIWVCEKNTYMGMVVSYCDKKDKFMRFIDFPPVVPIDCAGYEAIASGGQGASPGDASKALADAQMALAAATTRMPLDDKNNIFTIGALKRINEGLFHRTSWPALTAEANEWGQSYALKSTSIPGDQAQEPTYRTALNVRLEKAEAWHRYDNWMNTFNCISKSEQMVDPSWWFESNGQHWDVKQYFWDTPIGSMWLIPPGFQAGLWLLFGLDLGSAMSTYRKDWPLNLHKQSVAKHSGKSILQIYLVQRQAVSLWGKDDNGLVVQKAYKSPLECFKDKYADDEVDPVSYTLSGSPYFSLPWEADGEASQKDEVEPLYLMRGDDTRGNFQNNRHELQVIAAMDVYNSLLAEHGRRCPSDQERNQGLENAIYDLIEHMLTQDTEEMPKEFEPVHLDAEIL